MTTATVADRARTRWLAWLDRRIPPASTVTLDQRRIFIFPSQTGFFFFLCLLMMLIASINYQNNLGYALTFLLANLFVVAVMHTYANLAGLTITAVGADEAFAGQRTAFRLRLTTQARRGHCGLHVGWPVPREAQRRQRFLVGLFSSPQMQAQEEVNLDAGDQTEVRLHLPVGQRGWYSPGRLRIDSVYPLGLLRCWTWIDLDLRALVYPEPIQAGEPQGDAGEEKEGLQLRGSGDDEFSGIRDYREGDNPRRVHWKSLARGQALQSKEYAAVVSDTRWLDWSLFPGLGNERRLSALCYWVLDYHRRELEYGLRLPGHGLAPGKGDKHRSEALRLLALHGIEDAAL